VCTDTVYCDLRASILALLWVQECDIYIHTRGGADKSLALPTSRCILFDGENISFDASLVIYIYI
jgi:hypothetical protein